MGIKYKAKVVQVIPCEKSKGYGFIKRGNCDYLNLMQLDVWQHQQATMHALGHKIMKYCMMAGFAGLLIELGLFISLEIELPRPIVWLPPLLLFVPIVYALVYNHFWNKKYIKDYWYFDYPLIVNRPHDYKLNDTLDIEMTITKDGTNGA